MGKVTGLGHVGIYVQDMDKMLDFYTNVLGMTVTDHGMGGRIVFLSADPASEHHEIALALSPDKRTVAGQISFTVGSLEDLKQLYSNVRAYECQIDSVVNHGIAFGCYFRDPENNKIEIYWSTGIDYPQPFAERVDLDAPVTELMAKLDALEPRHGTGVHHYGRDVGKRISAPSAV